MSQSSFWEGSVALTTLGCVQAPGTPFGTLKQLLLGINGGGPGTRSQFAFDHLNLPAVRRLRISRLLALLLMSTSRQLCSPECITWRCCIVQIVNEMAVETAMLNQDRCSPVSPRCSLWQNSISAQRSVGCLNRNHGICSEEYSRLR